MVLVDANVLLDIITLDPTWAEWSAQHLQRSSAKGLAINPIIYAELAAGFSTMDALDRTLNFEGLERLELPYQAGFRAGKAFLEYRRRGGLRRSPLPDFYIGGHAEFARLTLLTRDAARYRAYFPRLKVIAPDDADETRS